MIMAEEIYLDKGVIDDYMFKRYKWINVFLHILFSIADEDRMTEYTVNGDPVEEKKGEYVFSHADLSSELDIGRSSIRNCLRYLEEKNKIEVTREANYTKVKLINKKGECYANKQEQVNELELGGHFNKSKTCSCL